MIFYDQKVEQTEQNLNDVGTKLFEYSLYGRLSMGLRDKLEELPSIDSPTSNMMQYTDLTKDTMEKIIEVFCKMKQNKKLEESEENEQDNEKENKDGKRTYSNFHKILKKRLNRKQLSVSTNL